MGNSYHDFAGVMSEKENDELLKIVEMEAADYQPAALNAAKEELMKRGISFKEAEPVEPKPLYYAEEHFADGRFWEYLIDYVVLLVIGVICYGAVGSEMLYTILIYPLFFLYYFLMETFFGKTVGKMILKMRVVDIDGNQPSTGAIALRTICRLIPFEAISFLFGGWREDHTYHGNWHDKLSKTFVVKE